MLNKQSRNFRHLHSWYYAQLDISEAITYSTSNNLDYSTTAPHPLYSQLQFYFTDEGQRPRRPGTPHNDNCCTRTLSHPLTLSVSANSQKNTSSHLASTTTSLAILDFFTVSQISNYLIQRSVTICRETLLSANTKEREPIV